MKKPDPYAIDLDDDDNFGEDDDDFGMEYQPTRKEEPKKQPP